MYFIICGTCFRHAFDSLQLQTKTLFLEGIGRYSIFWISSRHYKFPLIFSASLRLLKSKNPEKTRFAFKKKIWQLWHHLGQYKARTLWHLFQIQILMFLFPPPLFFLISNLMKSKKSKIVPNISPNCKRFAV